MNEWEKTVAEYNLSNPLTKEQMELHELLLAEVLTEVIAEEQPLAFKVVIHRWSIKPPWGATPATTVLL